MIAIYHNPKCSKSRQALAVCREQGVEPEVIEYLRNPPSLDTLNLLLEGLGGDLKLLTRGDDLKKAGLTASLELLAQEPKYLQRPILVEGNKVALARSPEAVMEFLQR